MATTRIRRIIATAVLLGALTAGSDHAAMATEVRLEGPGATIFQAPVTPFVGTLADRSGGRHRTTKKTALGALVAASRSKPFPLSLAWSDSFGGAWNGFYVTSINRVAPPATAFWALKIGHKLSPAGFGATPVGPASRVLVYYTTYDPKTFATQPTLAIGAADATPAVGVSVAITVRQYDDAGVASIPGQAWVWTNGVGTPVDGSGQVTVRFRRPGSYRLRATEPGAIRSRSLWVRVAS